MDHLEEQNMLKRAINGDKDAFSALLEEHYMMIYRTAYKWCGSQEDAEDIAQEVCIKVAKSISDFRLESRFTSWLYRITLNTAMDLHRKSTNHIDIDEVQVANTAEQDMKDHIDGRRLWQFVNKLPDKQRDAVLLVYGEDMNHGEAAEVMQCAESTISWYVHEGKKQLKILMSGDGR